MKIALRCGVEKKWEYISEWRMVPRDVSRLCWSVESRWQACVAIMKFILIQQHLRHGVVSTCGRVGLISFRKAGLLKRRSETRLKCDFAVTAGDCLFLRASTSAIKLAFTGVCRQSFLPVNELISNLMDAALTVSVVWPYY